jgi:hypothetical protein
MARSCIATVSHVGYWGPGKGRRHMGRYLIVANQTLGGVELDRAVRERIARDHSEFEVVVPMTALRNETAAWTGGFLIGDGLIPAELSAEMFEEHARAREAALEAARQRAEIRLDRMLERIELAGGEATGTVGDADPVAAVEVVLRDRDFDEIIISTLPAGISRWLKMDLSSRVSRMTDTPVTTIEAAPEPEPSA